MKQGIHGIRIEILHWNKSCLSGRKQYVVLNDSQSDWAPVPSLVPQGSGQGPLLFIVFINDMDDPIDIVNCSLLKLADDT